MTSPTGLALPEPDPAEALWRRRHSELEGFAQGLAEIPAGPLRELFTAFITGRDGFHTEGLGHLGAALTPGAVDPLWTALASANHRLMALQFDEPVPDHTLDRRPTLSHHDPRPGLIHRRGAGHVAPASSPLGSCS